VVGGVVWWQTSGRNEDGNIPPTKTDKRILLTPQNLAQYNSPQNPQCDEEFNTDPANTTVHYSNPGKGISFDVPYNTNWGSKKFKIDPYWEYNDQITFGSIGGFEACMWVRSNILHFRPQLSAEEVVNNIKKSDPPELIPVPPTTIKLNGLTVIKYATSGLCSYPAFQVIGEKYNYEFVTGCSVDIESDFKYLENIVNTIQIASSGWKSENFYNQGYLFTLRHPSEWKMEKGQDFKIKAKNSTNIFFGNDNQKKAPMLTAGEIQSDDFETIVSNLLKQESYKTAVIQDATIGNFWGRLINLDNSDVLVFVPLQEEIIVIRGHNLEWKTFDKILNEVNFSTEGIPMLFPTQYKTQRNIRNIRSQKADFNEDGINETVMSYISDDELFTGEGRTNGHIKVIDHAGKVIKEDIAPHGGNVYHPVMFDTVQVMDFGNDGKQELLVQKRTPYEESEDNKYYVFGFFDGEYADFPIQKGYLHSEKYIDCEKNKEDGFSNASLHFNGLEVSPDGILEKYSYFDYCNNGETKYVELFQRYHNEGFSPEIKNAKLTYEETKSVKNYYVKDGYLWQQDKKLIDQKLNDIIEHNGEGILDFTDAYSNAQFVDIYLTDGVGCGGCVWFLPTYLRINKKDNSAEILNLNQKTAQQFLGRGTPALSLLSPDKNKLAFVNPDYEGNDELWIYNFETQEEQLLKTFQKGETVAILMGGGGLYSTAIYWQPDSKHIIVKPFKKE
jgi:hypothetical protein